MNQQLFSEILRNRSIYIFGKLTICTNVCVNKGVIIFNIFFVNRFIYKKEVYIGTLEFKLFIFCFVYSAP